ncbi:MAG TPA: hypothetical protein VGM20_11045 [Gemmatimonadales bacterium]|jgi:uncharacterized membrane protein
MRTTRWSIPFFALTLIGLGIIGLGTRDFTTTWAGVPDWLPARTLLAIATAIITLACGTVILASRTRARASRLFLLALVLWFLLFRLPYIVISPLDRGAWWEVGDSAVMIAAAWIIYIHFADQRTKRLPLFRIDYTGQRIAAAIYGAGLILFGIAHFTFLARTIEFIPSWMPFHDAWAYITGLTFIAAGIALIVNVCAPLAADLSVLQLLLFTIIVWIPILASGHAASSDWTEFISSWTLTAAGWVVATSFRPSASGLTPDPA